MRAWGISLVVLAVACLGQVKAANTQSPAAPPAAQTFASSRSADRAFLDQYCVTCHNSRSGLGPTLSGIDPARVSDDLPTWEKVVVKLRTGTMPPPGAARPDGKAVDAFATRLEASLDAVAAAAANPGRPAAHRLNRAEYANAIRDLLALDVDPRALLPPDDSGYGFDNIGDVLSLSPMLLERYLAAAQKISRLAVGDKGIGPGVETFRFPKYLMQADRLSEDLPFASRGAAGIRYYAPLDGDYVIRVHLLRTSSGSAIKGLAEPHLLKIYLDGAVVKAFTVGGKNQAAASGLGNSEYERTADAGLEVRIHATAGSRLIGAAFLKETTEPEGLLRPRLTGYNFDYNLSADPEVASLDITGPYDGTGPGRTPSRARIFVCNPASPREDGTCARRILASLATRAYRRPATANDVDTLLAFYESARREGEDFEAGIERALERMLVGPEFLFRIERDPPNVARNTAYRLGDLELASRLSFFLWSSIPDDELRNLAVAGRLHEPAVLEQQVRRLLADERSRALAANFGGQWLQLRNLRFATPDLYRFPDFDENLRDAFERESQLFLESQIGEDHGVSELLTARYTFVNERLARHYGIPGVYGNRFRRVALPDDSPRGGLLGQGGFLTVTSNATRTSPVLRGKWLLETLLGTPPPPPPANVPDLPGPVRDERRLSMRERMEEHRANPTCAGCHKYMDPLGLALENFDAIGRWRTHEGTTAIDARGMLADGTRIDGAAELRKAMLGHRESVVRAVAQRLLTYAIGRGVEDFDAPAVRKIVREAAPTDYRWSALILGIVKSTPFQMRRSES